MGMSNVGWSPKISLCQEVESNILGSIIREVVIYTHTYSFHLVAGLQQAFRPFGGLNIEWPGKDGKHSRHPPKGMCTISLVENNRNVKGRNHFLRKGGKILLI